MKSEQYITPPQGFSPPPGTNQEDEFDASIRVKLEPDGRLCVKSINGTKLEETENESDEYEDEGPGRGPMMKAAMKDGFA